MPELIGLFGQDFLNETLVLFKEFIKFSNDFSVKFKMIDKIDRHVIQSFSVEQKLK